MGKTPAVQSGVILAQMKKNLMSHPVKEWFLFPFIFFCLCSKTVNKNKLEISQGKTNSQKERSPVIEKWATFIHLKLEMNPISKDSIIAKLTLTNTGQKEFKFYKPLLPYDNSTEDLFSILEKKTYNRLKFYGKNQEKYLATDAGPTDNIVPKLNNDQFITLQPAQSLEIKTNIAKEYSFDKSLKRKENEFKIIYIASFPYIVDGRQVTELDTVDKKQKPVYYIVSVEENKDPDLMKVSFKIPR